MATAPEGTVNTPSILYGTHACRTPERASPRTTKGQGTRPDLSADRAAPEVGGASVTCIAEAAERKNVIWVMRMAVSGKGDACMARKEEALFLGTHVRCSVAGTCTNRRSYAICIGLC